MILTRAPRQTVLDKFPLIGATIQATAGYILVFGPLAIATAIWWIAFTYRGSGIDAKHWTRGDLRFSAFLFSFPAFACAFFSLQFFSLAPRCGVGRFP